MSDTNACGHSQLVGQREFCPDCGLSRAEVLVESCAPFLKDDETPADCIRRNRKDVDGCLTMLVAEKRKNDALRAERDALRKDAERYRWLRDSAGNDIMEKLMAECSPPRWDELVDAAIDAAMGERP